MSKAQPGDGLLLLHPCEYIVGRGWGRATVIGWLASAGGNVYGARIRTANGVEIERNFASLRPVGGGEGKSEDSEKDPGS